MSDLDLPDVNVLVALLLPSHTHHDAALGWFETTGGFATTAMTESGLLRLALNPVITGIPLDTTTALRSLRSLRADDRAEFLADGSSLADAAIDVTGLVGHRQVPDFHLVNLAARTGSRLVTFDTKLRPVLIGPVRDRVHVLG